MASYDDAAASTPTAAGLVAELVMRADVARSWRASTPVGSMSIQRGQGGVWSVTLEGFSRSSNQSLEIALTEATGAQRSEPWLKRLVAELERTS
jgi:hypothetical protein